MFVCLFVANKAFDLLTFDMKCIYVLNVQYGVVHKTLFVYYINVLFYNKDKYVQNQFYRAE